MRREFPDETGAVVSAGDIIQFKPDEAEAILALAMLEISGWILDRMKREKITPDQADRWAKCTRIVFWNHLQKMEAGIMVWALITGGLLLSRKKLPKKESDSVPKS